MTHGTFIDPSIAPHRAETPDARPEARTPEELRQLAAQFEALLLSQMLSQMRSTLFDDEDGDSGFAKGPLADAMYSELSLALSRAGGFGLSESLIEPLLRQTGAVEAAPGVFPGASMPAMAPGAITMPAAAVTPDVRPALFSGRVTSAFGWRQHPVTGGKAFHKGVDIAMPTGRDVPAAQAGRVTFAGSQGAYGLTVVIDHGHGVSTRYAHLSELHVKAGDEVANGQTIARSGATGRVTGAHLHFEVMQDGQHVDPAENVGRLYARR